jgi:hypothetical protein
LEGISLCSASVLSARPAWFPFRASISPSSMSNSWLLPFAATSVYDVGCALGAVTPTFRRFGHTWYRCPAALQPSMSLVALRTISGSCMISFG